MLLNIYTDKSNLMINERFIFVSMAAADTPIYLATLPTGTTSPKGDFVTERAIIPWQDMVANDQL